MSETNVVSAVAELERQAENAEFAEAVLENVIEQAAQQVAAAQDTAEQIAAAAMEGARGQEIENLKKENELWQNEHRELKASVERLTETVSQLTGQIAGLATLTVASQSPEQTDLSSSIQPILEEPLPPEVEQIIPETLQNVAEENPAPAARPAKARRWI